MSWLNVSYFPQWPKSSVCPRLTQLRPVPSSHLRHPAPSTSCLCCCASDSAAVTCHFSRRCRPNDSQWQPKKKKKQTTCRRWPDFVLSLSLLRLSTHLSLRVTGSSCPWRSSSTLCPSHPAPRPQAPTPRTPWLSTAPASPRISLRTPMRAPRWATVMSTGLKYQLNS